MYDQDDDYGLVSWNSVLGSYSFHRRALVLINAHHVSVPRVSVL